MGIVESELGYKDQPVKTRRCLCIKITIRKVQFSSVKMSTTYNEQFVFHIYHPQTKLRKGNVFTSMCQEFCPGVYTP